MDEQRPQETADEAEYAEEKGRELPDPDFNVFITGLYTQTLVAMGGVPDPSGGEQKTDLREARFLIDTIAMLEKKTSGNLDKSEVNYLQEILGDLRMRYVRAAGRKEDGGERED